MAEFYALFTAVSFGMGSVFARKGVLKHQSAFNAVPAFAIGALILWAVVLVTHSTLPSGNALLLSLLRGVLDPGIAALLVFLAFRHLGVSITIPILASSPLISTTLSIFLFDETLTIIILAGTALVLLGVYFLSSKKQRMHLDSRYIPVAIGGMVLIGIGSVLSKAALPTSEAAIGSAAISFTAAVATQLTIVTVLRKWHSLPRAKHIYPYLAGSGTAGAVGFLFLFTALSQAPVSRVMPLAGTQPLFTLLFAQLFLRQHERINAHIIIGALLIVLGAAVLVS